MQSNTGCIWSFATQGSLGNSLHELPTLDLTSDEGGFLWSFGLETKGYLVNHSDWLSDKFI